jgi:hypothetical protein
MLRLLPVGDSVVYLADAFKAKRPSISNQQRTAGDHGHATQRTPSF